MGSQRPFEYVSGAAGEDGIEERVTWVLGGSRGSCGPGGRVNSFRPFHTPVGSSGHQTASFFTSFLAFLPGKPEMGFTHGSGPNG